MATLIKTSSGQLVSYGGKILKCSSGSNTIDFDGYSQTPTVVDLPNGQQLSLRCVYGDSNGYGEWDDEHIYMEFSADFSLATISVDCNGGYGTIVREYCEQGVDIYDLGDEILYDVQDHLWSHYGEYERDVDYIRDHYSYIATLTFDVENNKLYITRD